MIDLVNIQEDLYTTDRVAELVDRLDNIKANNFICAMGDLAITPTHMITPSGEHKLTLTGMTTLIKKLSVPINRNYAFKVDNDQLLYDINNLLNEDEREILYRVEDDNITGFINPKFQPVEHNSIIRSVADNPGDGFKIKEIKYSPSYMKMNLVTDDTIDVGDGDVSFTGLEILNSTIGSLQLQSSLLLYRLICSNGAIGISSAYRYVQDQLNRSEENIIESFYSRLIAYSWDTPEISEALKYMVKNSVNIIDDLIPKNQHLMLNSTEEPPDYNGINGIRYLLKSIAGKDDANSILEGCDDNSSQYDVYNVITAAAKQYGLDKSRKVEALGGKLVRYNINKLRLAA